MLISHEKPVGGLIGVATYKENGLLSKQMATFEINFSNSDICINFSTPYNLQPFFITCYLNGLFSTYLINPSTYQDLTYFKVKYLGRQDIEVYAKPGDGRVFIKTNATDNGRLSFQFMYERTANILNIENSITPEDFTKINMSEM